MRVNEVKSEYNDLKSIRSFGFRGEALASISHCAHLEIISKPSAQAVAHRIKFIDGAPVDVVKPAARRDGTTIRATELYHNMGTRKGTMSVGDERNKIGEIVRAYAVHYHRLMITWFRVDTNTAVLKTVGSLKRHDAIRSIFGKDIAFEMLHFKTTDKTLHLDIEAHCSNPSYEGKKLHLILFINGRLVNCKTIRQTIESVFATFVGKTSKPFVYLSLNMPGANIDVNVHPTKLEVQFLHEEKINDLLQKEFDKILAARSDERTMKCAASFFNTSETSINLDVTKVTTDSQSQPRRDNTKVREDARMLTLDSFIKPSENNEKVLTSRKSVKRKNELCLTLGGAVKRQRLELDSMKQLEEERAKNTDLDLSKILVNFSVVGAIDPSKYLVQYDVSLLLLDMASISTDMFHQILLRDYGNFDAVPVVPPVPLMQVCQMMELDCSGLKKVTKMSAMLSDYFAITIKDGNLSSLPIIIDDYAPPVNDIYKLINSLCTKVTWDSEKECLGSIARAIAEFYSIGSSLQRHQPNSWKATIEHGVMDTLKSNIYKPRDFGDTLPYKRVTSLPDLYKVFERC